MSRLTLLLAAMLAAMLPSVSYAVISHYWDCRYGDDPIMATHEGMMMLKDWGPLFLVARNDHESRFEKYDCLQAIFSWDTTETASFALMGMDTESNEAFAFGGKLSRRIDPIDDNLFFKVDYKEAPDENKFPSGFFHANAEAFEMKIIYASKSEVVLEACNSWGSWPGPRGSSRSAYVFSNQPNALADLDPTCMGEAVSKYAAVGYSLKLTNQTACLSGPDELVVG